MKIPLLQGVYADSAAAFHTSYPINLEPTLVDSGLSEGYVANIPGVTQIGTAPVSLSILSESGSPLITETGETLSTEGDGADRGSINWQGVCYRVMGSLLVSVASDGTTAILGDVGDNGLPVSMDYSFDRLAIASNQHLFYYCLPSGPNPGLTQVTDPDLGVVLDVMWIDSYFMTTDGENLVVTELNDPYAVDPLKYGSSEADPDPVVGLAKVRGEAYALNRNTIQNFQDLGGTGFPFTNNPGGLIPRGPVGTHAWSYFLENFAFVGSGRNEQLSVYIAGAGQTIPISTSEIDGILAAVSLADQALIQLESRTEKGEQRLYIHLPNQSLVYMHQASLKNRAKGEDAVWHLLADGPLMDQAYSPRHMCQVYDRWMVGDSAGRIGYLDDAVSTRWGEIVGDQFGTILVYNAGKGGIVKSLELVGLPGRAPFGVNPTIALSWTFDGQTWSQERFISMGGFGERRKRVQWRPKFRFQNYVGLRFRSANAAPVAWAALEADVEALAV